MSLEQLRAFLEKVKGNSNLQDKLKAAKSPEEVVSIAKEHGHEFTADKLSQLSEEELKRIDGGDTPIFQISQPSPLSPLPPLPPLPRL